MLRREPRTQGFVDAKRYIPSSWAAIFNPTDITNRVDLEYLVKRGFSANMGRAAREGLYLDTVMCRPNAYFLKNVYSVY